MRFTFLFRLTKGISFLAFILLLPLSGQSQDLIPFVDLHNYGATKAFTSRHTTKVSVWEHIEHDCSFNFGRDFVDAYADMAKQSQANFESMVKAKAPFTCLSYEPYEKPYLKSGYIKPSQLKGTLSCLSGMVAVDAIAYVQDIDYFSDFIGFYNYLKGQAFVSHNIFGENYGFSIVSNKDKLRETINDPSQLGVVLTITGGHTLGNSIFIENGLTEKEDYHNLVLNNILRLKGSLPLIENTMEYMAHPVLFIKLASNFPNGICGSARSLNKDQEKLFGSASHINKGFTNLGQAVISSTLSNSNGRRVLIDVTQMSVEARKQFYAYVRDFRKVGDRIPIVASHVGISGLSWDDPLYRKRDDEIKNRDSYLNHWTINLSRQDIMNIYESEGIIGISLDKNLLCGNQVDVAIANTVPGSAQQRQIYLQAIMANILKVVETTQNRFAWDMISIGTNFDNIIPPFPMYATAEDVPDLMYDMLKFLDNPGPVFDLYSAQDVRRLMYNYTPQEIVTKIFSSNAMEFVEKNLPDDALARTPGSDE
ncbi:MAG: hypothetical protein AAF502_20430 [Bacteroidota bacterium]